MKPLFILKLGGSVITEKDKQGGGIRHDLIAKISQNIRKIQKNNKFNLILVHGAGSVGHQLAHKYNLQDGISNKDKKKWEGCFISRIANPSMDLEIAAIMIENKLPVVSIHTATAVIQNNKIIKYFDIRTINEALKNNCVPMLYGEMVFDEKLGMTICSGDAIVTYLVKKLKADKLFFASDIDGVFNDDPHLSKNAILIKEIVLDKVGNDIRISGSHNLDVTGGLMGKIEKLKVLKKTELESVEIFNGLKPENYVKILLDKKFLHTTIKIKK